MFRNMKIYSEHFHCSHILFNVSISVLWHVYRVYIMMDRARYHGIYQEIWENPGSILSNISRHFVAKNGRWRNRQDLTKKPIFFTNLNYIEWIELDIKSGVCKYLKLKSADISNQIKYLTKTNWGLGADCLELNAAETKINYTGRELSRKQFASNFINSIPHLYFSIPHYNSQYIFKEREKACIWIPISNFMN